MIRLLSLLTIVMLTAAGARAERVCLQEPGTLHSAVAAPDAVVSLQIEGPVDASDFAFMAAEMPSLASLDLSQATIAAYKGEPIAGRRLYAAATLPSMLLAGVPLTDITLPGTLEVIGNGALAGTMLRTVDVPDGVRTIGRGAFAGCPQLTTVRIGTARLSAATFAGCTALSSVTLAATDIPERCFAGCTALTEIEGAGNFTSVGERAFKDCTALKSFVFGKGLKKIGARAFAASGLESADLSGCSALESVGNGAFTACAGLVELLLPDRPVQTGNAVAMGSTALRRVLLAPGTLPPYALAGDREADAEETVRQADEIGPYALQGVSAMESVSLSPSLGYLGDGAMEGMTGLRTIDASALTSVPELGNDVWQGVNQAGTTLITAPEMADAFLAAGQWQEFRIATSGIDDADDALPATGRLRAFFEGNTLIVECEGTGPGTSILLHDTAGHLLATLTLTPDGRCAVDTSRWIERAYLVSARDNRMNTLTTIKIARNG